MEEEDSIFPNQSLETNVCWHYAGRYVFNLASDMQSFTLKLNDTLKYISEKQQRQHVWNAES